MFVNGGLLEGKWFILVERVVGFIRFCYGVYDFERILFILVWFGVVGFWFGGEEGILDFLVGSYWDIVYSLGVGGLVVWVDLKEGFVVVICYNNMDILMVMELERIFVLIVEVVWKMVRLSGWGWWEVVCGRLIGIYLFYVYSWS